jgi:hypothetical protein
VAGSLARLASTPAVGGPYRLARQCVHRRHTPEFFPTTSSPERFCIQVGEDLLDYDRVFDTGNDPHCPATGRAGLDVDTEHPFQALRPGHCGAAFAQRGFIETLWRRTLTALASPARRHSRPQSTDVVPSIRTQPAGNSCIPKQWARPRLSPRLTAMELRDPAMHDIPIQSAPARKVDAGHRSREVQRWQDQAAGTRSQASRIPRTRIFGASRCPGRPPNPEKKIPMLQRGSGP